VKISRSQQGRGLRRLPLAAGRRAKLLAVLPHHRRRWFQPDADATPVIDEGALGGNSFDPQTLPMAFAA
jgi:hypothetical protein